MLQEVSQLTQLNYFCKTSFIGKNICCLSSFAFYDVALEIMPYAAYVRNDISEPNLSVKTRYSNTSNITVLSCQKY